MGAPAPVQKQWGPPADAGGSGGRGSWTPRVSGLCGVFDSPLTAYCSKVGPLGSLWPPPVAPRPKAITPYEEWPLPPAPGFVMSGRTMSSLLWASNGISVGGRVVSGPVAGFQYCCRYPSDICMTIRYLALPAVWPKDLLARRSGKQPRPTPRCLRTSRRARCQFFIG